jgi:choline dehydrogenase
MGRDAMSVVDGKLKVYGVDGLRVADASIMPRVTTGNTMAPCVVIGEQAATLLCSEHKLKDSSLNAAVETDLTQEKLSPVFDTSF